MRFLVFLIFLLISFSVNANNSHKLPTTIEYSNIGFELCSQQKITKAWFFDIVLLGLYSPNCNKFDSIFSDQVKLVRFHYLRKVKGKDFSDGAEEYLNKNLTKTQLAQCLTSYHKLNNSYQDASKGDFYDVLHFTTHTDVYLNGKKFNSIDDPDCDNLYWNIWFGKKTMDSGFIKLLQNLTTHASNDKAVSRADL